MTRLTVLLSLGCLVASPIDAQSVKVSVLDRGRADSIVIRTPNLDHNGGKFNVLETSGYSGS